MKTIKELEPEKMNGNKLGYLNALKDVLGLIKSIHTDNKVGLAILKEIERQITGEEQGK